MSNVVCLALSVFEREFKEAHSLLMDMTGGDPLYISVEELLESLHERALELGLDPWLMDWDVLEDAFDSFDPPDLTNLMLEVPR